MAQERTELGTQSSTGFKCPESGVWETTFHEKHGQWEPVAEGEDTTIPLAEGETFPPHRNHDTIWTLIRYA